MKVHLRGTKTNSIDFVYDSTTSLLKIQVRYTTLTVKAGHHVTFQQLLNEVNCSNGSSIQVVNEVNHDNQPGSDHKDNHVDLSLINESFWDSDSNVNYKVKSLINDQLIKVICYDFMLDQESGDEIEYSKSQAIKFINQQK